MRYLILTLTILAVTFAISSNATAQDNKKDNAMHFSFKPLEGDKNIEFSDLKGHVILIVNTASKCGFTGQYEGLEELYNRYKDQNFTVIGVPSDDFGGQELDSNADVASFCERNFGVSFPMATITKVKGKDAHPFYVWAKDELGFGTAPKWNFHKYLIARNGELVDYFHSTTKPTSNSVVKAIEAELAK